MSKVQNNVKQQRYYANGASLTSAFLTGQRIEQHEASTTTMTTSLSLIQVSPIKQQYAKSDNNRPLLPEGFVKLCAPLVKLHLNQLTGSLMSSSPTNETGSSSLKVIWDDDCFFVHHHHHQKQQSFVDEKNHEKCSTNIGGGGKWKIKSGTAFEPKISIDNPTNRIINTIQTTFLEKKNADRHTKTIAHHEKTTSFIIPQPFILIPSPDPTNDCGIPCHVRVFSIPFLSTSSSSSSPSFSPSLSSQPTTISIESGTMVQILPPIEALNIDKTNYIFHTRIQHQLLLTTKEIVQRVEFVHSLNLTDSLLGEVVNHNIIHENRFDKQQQHGIIRNVVNHNNKDNDDEVLSCYEPETVRALTMRMKMVLSHQILVGTTRDAFTIWDDGQERRSRMQKAINRFWKSPLKNNVDSNTNNNNNNNKETRIETNDRVLVLLDGALTVHDPTHGSGKTTLVTRIAQSILGCQSVHTIDGSSLFAKYGASGADAALESLLHRFVLASAATRLGCDDDDDDDDSIGRVCIILDHLETFVPPQQGGIGDPAIPALNAIAAYLDKLVHSLSKNKRFPYPSKNPLYNFNGREGYVIPVKLCLVGIVTCNDDIGRKSGQGSSNNSKSVLDVLGENRYRLPALSPIGRYTR